MACPGSHAGLSRRGQPGWCPPLATAHPTELSHLTSLSRNLNQKLRQQVHRAILPLDWGTLLSVQMLLEACSGATQGSAPGEVPPTASITVQQSLPHAPPLTPALFCYVFTYHHSPRSGSHIKGHYGCG